MKSKRILDDDSSSSFESDCSDLLDDIYEYCTSGKKIPDNLTGEYKKVWEGRVFRDFIKRDKGLREKFKREFENSTEITITYHTFDVSYGGIKPVNAEKIFLLSARVHDSSLTDYLRDFVIYCKEVKKFDHRAFKKHPKTIKTLLKNRDSNEIVQSSLTLQDQSIITNKIRRIKQEVGFYPFGKNSTNPFDETKFYPALSDVNKLLESAQDNVDLLALKSWFLALLGRHTEALVIVEPLYGSDSHNVDVITAYASTLSLLGRTEDAINILRDGKEHHPDNPVLCFKLGAYLSKLGRQDEAIDELKQAIDKDSSYVPPYYVLANIYYGLKQYRQSESILNKALHISPNDFGLKSKLIKVLQALERYNEAEKIAITLSGSARSELDAIFIEAVRAFNETGLETAINIVTEYVDRQNYDPLGSDANKALAFERLANLFEVDYGKSKNKKHYSLAKEYYSKSLEFSKTSDTALLKLAFFHFGDNEDELCKDCLNRLCELQDYPNLGFSEPDEIYASLSKSAQAHLPEKDYKLPLLWCLDRTPDSVLVLVGLMRSFTYEGDLEKGRIYADKAIIAIERVDRQTISALYMGLVYSLVEALFSLSKMLLEPNCYDDKILSLLSLCSSDVAKTMDIAIWKKSLRIKNERELELGLSKNNDELLKTAIAGSSLLLKATHRHQDPNVWREINLTLAHAYIGLGNVQKTQSNLSNAITYLKNAIEEYSIETEKEEWVNISIILADRLSQYGDDYSDVHYLERSANTYQSIMDVLDNENEKWLECQFQFARAYQGIGFLSSDLDAFWKSSEAYKKVLEIDRRSGDVNEYVPSLYGCGLSLIKYCQLEKNPSIRLLEECVATFTEMIQASSTKDDPLQYVVVHELYADALHLLGGVRKDRELFDKAKASYFEAEKGYRKLNCEEELNRTLNSIAELEEKFSLV